MNTPDKKEVEQQSEEARQKAADEARENATVHTVNPFTGTEADISQSDLEGIEKWKEAQTERD